MAPADRVIVALDVPSKDDALRVVEDLDGLVSFYKVGLELLVSGGVEELLRALAGKKQLFLDLKLPNDIPATVTAAVRKAASLGVRFLTLSHSAEPATMAAAVRGRAEGGRDARSMQLLTVPFLSSTSPEDFARQAGRAASDFRGELLRRATEAKGFGADGFIVSGQEIALLRERFPGATLVSPGIRPAWAGADDHKRSCTPSEAVLLGSDYIVVGRPIVKAGDRQARREAAGKVIDELTSRAPA